ncbi:hypothetical protein BYT27DRAFT_7247538 [Phlegmacium glaucopus]|nr:hypothetical protein BYT27DRAFT_7247538 [Phlegmacium glaucopus]
MSKLNEVNKLTDIYFEKQDDHLKLTKSTTASPFQYHGYADLMGLKYHMWEYEQTHEASLADGNLKGTAEVKNYVMAMVAQADLSEDTGVDRTVRGARNQGMLHLKGAQRDRIREHGPSCQSTLLATLDKGKSKKKRPLALTNGNELDLSSSLPVTLEILEAMRTCIIELEDEPAQQPPNETCSNERCTKRA